MSAPAMIVFTPGGSELPGSLRAWLQEQDAPVVQVSSGDELMAIALRGRPRLVLFDARSNTNAVLAACSRLKNDSYSGVVPTFVIIGEGAPAVAAAFDSGADARDRFFDDYVSSSARGDIKRLENRYTGRQQG